MRRSVFFAVWLGLVLSLLKEATAATPADTAVTTSSITSGNSADNETAPEPPEMPTSEHTEKGADNERDPEGPEEKPSEPSGNSTDNGTAPEAPVVPAPEPSGNSTGNGTAPEPPVVPAPEPSGNSTDNGTAPEAPVVPAPEPSGNSTGNGTAPEPPVVPAPEPSGNSTDNGTAPEAPVVPAPEPSGNSTDNGTAPEPPVVPAPEPSGNSTDNGTAPEAPVVPAPEPSGNSTDNGTAPEPPVVPAPEPSGNSTDNGTAPEAPVVPAPEPSGNSTDNGTAPEPPVVPAPEPSGNSTDNGTAPEPSVVPSPEPSGNSTGNATGTESPTVTPSAPSDNSTANGTDPDATEMPTSAPTVDFCHGDPCGRSSATCISLQSNYTCVCKYGYYYSNENCYKGEVFPATIAVNISYSDNLEIVNSTEYQELSSNVSAFFRKAFKDLPGYVETVIMKIQRPTQNRNSAPGLNVTVTNLFKENSNETTATVNTAVQNAIKSDQSFVNSYEVASHCDVYECDLKTTVCEGQEFPECNCKPGLEKTQWDDRSCSVCSKNCSAENHKYCVQEEEGPTCKCMINFKTEAGECVACSVGYSGEECTDNSELILIIVGTVLGAIILSLLIAVSVISVRAKHKQNPEKRSLIKSGYSDMNTSDDRPSIFPRVQTTSGHGNPGYQPNNPYEMRSTNRDRFPERDYDDLYEVSREPTGFRTQSRY
ncbi:mucin-13 isoform X6 [Haemorhous mexicanus]|uniref:mucin-13 isoform X6 n=1 Tax=Haemorhous mexicanus TaxID=30427 RepID=UPI0028BF0A6B|nr:mucin-13 isoform X6 [Haemorhous mexicanus]